MSFESLAPERRLGFGVNHLVALLFVAALIVGGALLAAAGSRGAYYSWGAGLALGAVFQRGRFCFYCIFREFIEERKADGMLAVLIALAVGLIGYHVVLTAWLPVPEGRLPPGAFVTPVSWVLVLAGVAFGVGMALSGACISGHLYRLGEGYGRAPIALVGSLGGFGLGFLTWSTLYVNVIAHGDAVWLPAVLGHGWALAVQLVVLLVAAVALALVNRSSVRPAVSRPLTLGKLYGEVFVRRWPPLITGVLVGLIGVIAYFRVEPLGVTAQLSTVSRTVLDSAGLLAGRLPGLDTLAGCIAVVSRAVIDNGWLVIAFVLASAASAQLGGTFRLTLPTLRNGATALIGGGLMGWGSMTALGCTVGALLSGVMAGALSGWVFFAACFAGVWLGVKAGLHKL